MIDILPNIRELINQKKEFAIATVIKTWRSAPRPIGSSLVVTADGNMIGSVSGGCVEKSVLQKALRSLEKGAAVVSDYGVSNDEAWEVGLSCGGAISLHIDRFFGGAASGYDQLWNELDRAIEDNISVAIVTSLNSPSNYSLVYADGNSAGYLLKHPNSQLTDSAKAAISNRASQVVEIEEGKYFVHVFPNKAVMLMIGSAHITSELLTLAHMYGFEAIIVDPRDTFATKTNFDRKPDKMYIKWPQEILTELNLDKDTYAVILSHDPKIDDEALNILLRSDVAYIGALGSKKTHEKRLTRMRDRGFTDDELSKIHAPIGIDIGALLPREIALSVMAEVVKVKNKSQYH